MNLLNWYLTFSQEIMRGLEINKLSPFFTTKAGEITFSLLLLVLMAIFLYTSHILIKTFFKKTNYIEHFVELNFHQEKNVKKKSKNRNIKREVKKVFIGFHFSLTKEYILIKYRKSLSLEDISNKKNNIETFTDKKIVKVQKKRFLIWKNAIRIKFEDFPLKYSFKRSDYQNLKRFHVLTGLNANKEKIILDLRNDSYFTNIRGRGGTGKTYLINTFALSLALNSKNKNIEIVVISSKTSDFLELRELHKNTKLLTPSTKEDLKEIHYFFEDLNNIVPIIDKKAQENSIKFEDYQELRDRDLFKDVLPPARLIVVDEAHKLLTPLKINKDSSEFDILKFKIGKEISTHLNQNRFTNNFTIISTPGAYSQDLIVNNSLFSTFISGNLPNNDLSKSFHQGSKLANDSSLTKGKMVITSPSLSETTVFKSPFTKVEDYKK